jgi:hypothetical protein
MIEHFGIRVMIEHFGIRVLGIISKCYNHFFFVIVLISVIPSSSLIQRFLNCGPRTPGVRDAYSGGPRLFRKLNNFSQQINKVYLFKKAKSKI